MSDAIVNPRLQSQLLARSGSRDPAGVVAWFGAVQAQEFPAALWALGLRTRDGVTAVGIARAFDRGRILRTHVLRPTWHFVTPADLRWMLHLTAERVRRAVAWSDRRLGLETRAITRATAIIERTLGDRRYATRAELAATLARAGLPTGENRMAHYTMHAELSGIVCSGPRRDRQFTYALLAERAPAPRRQPSRDEALAMLAQRYLQSHGPATVRDFVWWSGLVTADARRGLDAIQARKMEVGGLAYWTLRQGTRSGGRAALVHLLPVYDEYTVAYRDRVAVPFGRSLSGPASSPAATFHHTLAIRGRIGGSWRTAGGSGRVAVQVAAPTRLGPAVREALAQAAERYGRFLGAPVMLHLT